MIRGLVRSILLKADNGNLNKRGAVKYGGYCRVL